MSLSVLGTRLWNTPSRPLHWPDTLSSAHLLPNHSPLNKEHDMKQFDARAYSIADFLEWHTTSLLEVSPDFQRRAVWTRAAKSFLIDTILRGKPMPKVLLTQSLVGKKNIRTVVDGQQRIRAILEFVDGAFTVFRTHNREYARKRFADLDEETQGRFLKYEIGVDLLYNVSLTEMLDIFARINTYAVTLNKQEKLNAKYLGVFKTVAYELGFHYVEYFIDGKVLTKQQVSRMAEAQLASDMLVALIGGVQTNKNVDKYYRHYEEYDHVPKEISDAAERFRKTMMYIGAIYPPSELQNTNWARPHWFYTLFTCIAHADMPLTGLEEAARPPLDTGAVLPWRSALNEISAQYDVYTRLDEDDVPAEYARFIDYARRRTTDTDARRERAVFVLNGILNEAQRAD